MLVEQHNPAMNDIAASMTASLARDGRGGMLGPLPMNGRSVTNMADGVNPNDAATVRQAISGGLGLPIFTPELYGAKGDGATNDTLAFVAMSAAIQAAGAGRIELSTGATYLVGSQGLATPGLWRFTPSGIIRVRFIPGSLIVNGNGAKLKCASGLRFGAFDAAGNPSPGQITDGNYRASPYEGMIYAEGCAGGVVVRDIELDGQKETLILGGGYGDTGRQTPGSGLFLYENGPVFIDNVNTHHHALDGAELKAFYPNETAQGFGGSVRGLVSQFNARNQVSLDGGRGWSFYDLKANYAGKTDPNTPSFWSAPGAGVDIEAENSIIRDVFFDNLEARGNYGCGLVADSGDSANIKITRSRLVGTSTGPALWARKPGFNVSDTLIAGSMVSPWDDGGVAQAGSAVFRDVLFTNDPVYGGAPSQPFVLQGDGGNCAALYENVDVVAVGGTKSVILQGFANRLHNVRISQVVAADMNIAGTWTGDNIVNIPAPGYINPGSHIYDRTYLRGALQPVSNPPANM